MCFAVFWGFLCCCHGEFGFIRDAWWRHSASSVPSDVLVLSAVHGQGLESFITPMAEVPSPLLAGSSTGEMVLNPEYVNWIWHD